MYILFLERPAIFYAFIWNLKMQKWTEYITYKNIENIHNRILIIIFSQVELVSRKREFV